MKTVTSRAVQNSPITSRSFLCLLAAFIVGSSSSTAGVILVDARQTNNVPDGTAWNTAYASVQRAIDAAAVGDEIWVAAASYFEALKAKNGVALYGGFAGTESDRSQRNYKQYRSILDGGYTNRVLEFATGATNTTRVDGFVITHGGASLGSAIYLNSTSSPVISNNLLIRNLGPAIRCWFQSAPLIAFNQLQENAGTNCATAGIDCVDASPRVYNNLFLANNVNDGNTAGAINCSLGAPEILNNVFAANTASTALPTSASAVLIKPDSAARIINNTFLDNGIGSIAALNCLSSQAVIANNLVIFNSGGVGGNPGMQFVNNCVYGNAWTNYNGFVDPTGTVGNISVDPQLGPISCFPNVHLTASSPCRSAGDASYVISNWVDIDGEPRTTQTSVDIGADEYNTLTPPYQPRIVRVRADGDDHNDGSAWGSAKRSIQEALEESCTTGGEVWVQAGVYAENLSLRPFAYLYGGFAGSEMSRDQRNWKLNASILDGARQGSVITAQQLLGWSRIDGLVIRNGLARRGGGVYIANSELVLANNIISNNLATNFSIGPTSFSYGDGIGGAIYLVGSCMVSNNAIMFNRAISGGGIYCASGSNVIANNRFEGNVAHKIEATGGLSPVGGGAICTATYSRPQIVNNFFLANVATNDTTTPFPAEGGAILCAAHFQSIIGNTFLGNVAIGSNTVYLENGGGICSSFGIGIIANNLIAFGSSGLELHTGEPSWTLYNNCVFGNGTNYLFTPDTTGTNGNISVDPALASMTDYHLTSQSPCIDAGADDLVVPGTFDLDGQVRVSGTHVDIGADEYGAFRPFSLQLAWSGQEFRLSLIGEPGRTYVFETSEDSQSWSPFSTNCATETCLDLTPPPGSSAVKLYRAKLAP